MRENARKILFIVSCGCFFTFIANAKVWLLPDYQQRQLYSHRVNTNKQGSTNDPQGVTCQTYGLISAAEIEDGMSCDTKKQIMHLTCYGNCHCPSIYDKTEASCRSEGKIPGGSSCAGEYYASCVCDTSVYPHTSSSCAYTLGGASCSDENGKHYVNCINPCEDLTDYKTEFGCDKYYDQCPNLCEVGAIDPCEGVVDNETDLGCEKYYDECPAKCEIGKTCVANNCAGYDLISCPVGSVCEPCTVGCGDNIPRYKVTCTPRDCSQYTLTTPPANAVYDTCSVGCGETTQKYKITSCQSGYALLNGECTTLCNGIYRYKIASNVTEFVQALDLAPQMGSTSPYPSKGESSFGLLPDLSNIDVTAVPSSTLEKRDVIVVTEDIDVGSYIQGTPILTNQLSINLQDTLLVGPRYLDCSSAQPTELTDKQPTVRLSRSNVYVPLVLDNSVISDVNLYFGHTYQNDPVFSSYTRAAAVFVKSHLNIINNTYMDIYTEGTPNLTDNAIFWLDGNAMLKFSGLGLFHMDSRNDARAHRFIGGSSDATCIQGNGGDMLIDFQNASPYLSSGVHTEFYGDVTLWNQYNSEFNLEDTVFSLKLDASTLNSTGYSPNSVIGSQAWAYFSGNTSLYISYRKGATVCISSGNYGCWKVLKDGCSGMPVSGSCFSKISDYQQP